jgi:drug/metabolite transporter (DMT)-like permease
MMAHSKTLNAVAPGLFVILWASGFVMARLTAGHVEPVSFLAFRFPLAALCMLALVLAFRERMLSAREAFHAATVGFFLHAAYFSCVFWAVSHGLPAGVNALIVALQPIVTAFMAVPMLGERVDGKHWLGLAAGVTGVVLVLSPKFSLASIDGITPVTSSIAIIGMLCATLGTIYQKRFASSLPLLPAIMWQYMGASIAVLILAALTENFAFDGTVQAWVGLAWAVVVLSVGAILILMYLIREGAVAKVSTLMFLVPGVTAVITYFMFGELLTLMQIIGMAVTAAAVIIVNRRPRARST